VETFVALKLEIQNWRWADVPFYLRIGKRLPRRATEIAVQFKRPPLMLFRESASEPEPNLLAMRIQPDEGILLRFAAKVPELGLDVRSVNMDFTYGSSFLRDAPEAYETLILDAMLGDASLFTRADEVEAAWGIVTPVHHIWAAWDREMTKGEKGTGLAVDGGVQPYEAGTWGPAAADRLMERDGRRWRRL
jgi:glucose-6-phosphate 1-dehydrogenase